MEGKNYRIGNVDGLIWYKRKSGEIPEMEVHREEKMTKIFHFFWKGK